MERSPEDGAEKVSARGSAEESERPMGSPTASPHLAARGPAPVWFRIVPFFLSALLFFSGFFAVLAPMPLLILGAWAGRPLRIVAVLVNAAILFWLDGPITCGLFLVGVGSLAVALPEFLWLRWSPTRAAVGSGIAMFLVAAGLTWAVARSQGISWGDWFQSVRGTFDQGLTSLFESAGSEGFRSWFGAGSSDGVEPTLEEIKAAVLAEIPSAFAILGLVMITLNLSLLMRLNPAWIRERAGWERYFFRRWKAPELLVWPTIASAALLMFLPEQGSAIAQNATWVALNTFKFLMAVYAIQGLSVMSYFFGVLRLRGLFRPIGYALALFVTLPLLLSLGFFDLWFDFRGKLRQS